MLHVHVKNEISTHLGSIYHYILSFTYVCYQKLLFQAKRRLGEILSAFEFLDAQAMNLVKNWGQDSYLSSFYKFSAVLGLSLTKAVTFHHISTVNFYLYIIVIMIICVLQVLHLLDGARNPLPSSIYNFYVLIETTGSNESNDK